MDRFDPDAWPARVNLGCGFDRRDGYLNVDLHEWHEPDLLADVRDLAALPDGRYEEILAYDVLEHLRREDGPVALAEWARIAAEGAILRLRVPNLLGLAVLLQEAGADLQKQRELVQCLFGTQAYDGDFHQNGYTELLLRAELARAGWRCTEVAPRDEWMFEVEAVRATSVERPRLADCRFMELRLPSEVLRQAGRGGRSATVEDEVRRRLRRARTTARRLARPVVARLRRGR